MRGGDAADGDVVELIIQHGELMRVTRHARGASGEGNVSRAVEECVVLRCDGERDAAAACGDGHTGW